jgi:transmembrane sensor
VEQNKPMTDYSNYKCEDLLLDESFLNYCREPEGSDRLLWKQRLSEYPQLAAEAKLARQLFAIVSITVPGEQKTEAIKQVTKQINSGTGGESLAPVHFIRKPRRSNWVRYAIAVMLIGIVAAAIFWFSSGVDGSLKQPDYAVVAFQQEISAGQNERREVKLPDGSTATLNYGSTIKIAADYNAVTRWVYLSGEAFFSVKKDANRPFVVITSESATTALGTSFKVRSYPGEVGGNIMLATGKVKVESVQKKREDSKQVFLMPGEQVSWNDKRAFKKEQFDQKILEDWRVTNIVFDRANLKSIIASLEFNYGIQVKMENNPGNAIGFTGKFYGKSLKDVLEAIAFTNKFTYSHNGNIVSIRFQ